MKIQNDILYSFEDFSEREEREFSNTLFVNCMFIQTQFGKAKFSNCMFIACNFSLGSFGESEWKRCTFKGCDFNNSRFDICKFIECLAAQSTFEASDLGRCTFGFNSTDSCDFLTARIPVGTFISSTCRELIGELVRQSSDRIRVQAYASMLKVNRQWCWETLIALGQSFLDEDDIDFIVSALGRHLTLNELIKKFLPIKEIVYGA